MSKKEEAVEQLKNCEDMHIWVKPIKDYIKELEAKEERAKKEHELLGLYKQRDYLLSNKPKTKYQIDIWKQRLKNNQYTQECLVKELGW